MLDIFKELELLKALIKENEYDVNGLVKYYYDILRASFINQVDYINMDSCLDHINYFEYTKLITQNLKQILKGIQQEINKSNNKIKTLKYLLEQKLTKVIELSTITQDELTQILEVFQINPEESLPKFNSLSLLIKLGSDLRINPIVDNLLSIEALEFILTYIKEKYLDEEITISSSLASYQNSTQKR